MTVGAIAGGALLGMLLAGPLPESVSSYEVAADTRAAEDRLDIGRDSYNVETRRTIATSAAPQEVHSSEYGKMRNGARVLVPFEPARRRDRREIGTVDDWQDENFPAMTKDDDGFLYDVKEDDRIAKRRARAIEQEETIRTAMGRKPTRPEPAQPEDQRPTVVVIDPG